ncbi:MAG: DUF1285 domain-containing protein, partial [Syntrophales bacterium]|nr:DUF1285 domain-containing protein [Syntrophales bacterium]
MTQNKNSVSGSAKDIHIDKDGIWYYRGAEMFRKEILKLFFEALGYDKQSGYYVEMKGERNYIEVEDTPFVVMSVTAKTSGSVVEEIEILLNDEKREGLDPETLRVGFDNVLYCSVKSGS